MIESVEPKTQFPNASEDAVGAAIRDPDALARLAPLQAVVAGHRKLVGRFRFGALGSLFGVACTALIAQSLLPCLVPVAIGGLLASSFCGMFWMIGSSVASNLQTELDSLVKSTASLTERNRLEMETSGGVEKHIKLPERRPAIEPHQNPVVAGTGLSLAISSSRDIETLLREAIEEQEQMRGPVRTSTVTREYIAPPQL